MTSITFTKQINKFHRIFPIAGKHRQISLIINDMSRREATVRAQKESVTGKQTLLCLEFIATRNIQCFNMGQHRFSATVMHV